MAFLILTSKPTVLGGSDNYGQKLSASVCPAKTFNVSHMIEIVRHPFGRQLYATWPTSNFSRVWKWPFSHLGSRWFWRSRTGERDSLDRKSLVIRSREREREWDYEKKNFQVKYRYQLQQRASVPSLWRWATGREVRYWWQKFTAIP